jgi:hypothetical protein
MANSKPTELILAAVGGAAAAAALALTCLRPAGASSSKPTKGRSAKCEQFHARPELDSIHQFNMVLHLYSSVNPPANPRTHIRCWSWLAANAARPSGCLGALRLGPRTADCAGMIKATPGMLEQYMQLCTPAGLRAPASTGISISSNSVAPPFR